MASSSGIVKVGKYEIEKFNGKNDFSYWRMQMKNLLISQKLHKALAGKEQKPVSMKDEDWEELDLEARAAIILCLERDVAFLVNEEATAAGVWLKLEANFMTKTLTNRIYLKSKLYTCKMEEGTSIRDYINKFDRIISNLKDIDVKIDEEDQALMLLLSLPKSYENLVQTLMLVGDTLTMDETRTSLLADDLRKVATSGMLSISGREQAHGLFASRGRTNERIKGKGGKSRSKSRAPVERACFKCGELGHFKANCPNKRVIYKNNNNDNFARKQQEKQEASYVSNDEDDYCYSVSEQCNEISDKWMLDSGASHHMCPNRKWFTTYQRLDGGIVLMGNDHACKTIGIGTIRVKTHDGTIITLKDVRHIPDLRKNLISLGLLEKNGCKIIMEDGVLKVVRGSLVVMKGIRHGNLYPLLGITVTGDLAVGIAGNKDQTESTRIWHMRLGHMSEKGLSLLSGKGLLKNMKKPQMEFCEHCVYGKSHRVRFSTSKHKSRGLLDYVHTDVWGPAKVTSKGGSRYFVTFVDDHSRYAWIYFLKHKNEVFDIFKQWKAMVENRTGRKLKTVRSDNGTEYTEGAFKEFCNREGIVRHWTVRDTPQQNGVAERLNRTLLEKARCMRSNSGLGREWWAESVATACYIVNRSPHSYLDGEIPFKVWSGEHADYDKLKVFGCIAYYHVKDNKLDERAKKAIFLGYPKGVKGYRLWSIEDSKFIISRDVTFDERSMAVVSKVMIPSNDDARTSNTQVVEIESRKQPDSIQVENHDVNQDEVDHLDHEEIQQENAHVLQQQQEESLATTRPKRNYKQVQKFGSDKPLRHYGQVNLVEYALLVEDDEPVTFKQAIKDKDRESWVVAMEEEMQSLHKNKTWEVVPLPVGKSAIGCKWVYKRKEDPTKSSGTRYKARLVAKGFAQKEGVDYNEIFSPVVKHTSIRVLLSIVAHLDLELEQLDVKTAFLHGDLNEEIYMHQPEGYKVEGKESQVCRLRKSLYGLKQSPRQWYKRFDSFMLKQGFFRSAYDCCVYIHMLRGGDYIYLVLYVDDMLIASKSKVEIDRLKAQLGKEFETKDLGVAKKILGMEITRERSSRKLFLTQKGYIERVIERFGMKGAKSVVTPLAPHFRLSSKQSPVTEEEKASMEYVPYASAIGSLMYAMVCTRPDISQAVSVVSRFMANPGKAHWEAVKWVLRYLKGTVDTGLCFGVDTCDLSGFVDSDYAGDLDKRRSTTGYVFKINGAPVSWRSMLQATVALSTTEAEYMSIAEGVKEALWLWGLLNSLGIKQNCVDLSCDSQSAIHLAKNQVHHARTKHIDVRYHFVRDVIEEGNISLLKVHTNENPADMLTKVVSGSKFQHCLKLLNIIPC